MPAYITQFCKSLNGRGLQSTEGTLQLNKLIYLFILKESKLLYFSFRLLSLLFSSCFHHSEQTVQRCHLIQGKRSRIPTGGLLIKAKGHRKAVLLLPCVHQLIQQVQIVLNQWHYSACDNMSVFSSEENKPNMHIKNSRWGCMTVTHEVVKIIFKSLSNDM